MLGAFRGQPIEQVLGRVVAKANDGLGQAERNDANEGLEGNEDEGAQESEIFAPGAVSFMAKALCAAGRVETLPEETPNEGDSSHCEDLSASQKYIGECMKEPSRHD